MYVRTGSRRAGGRKPWQFPGSGPYRLTYQDRTGQQVDVSSQGRSLRFRSLREAEWFRSRRRLHLPSNVQVIYREDGKR